MTSSGSLPLSTRCRFGYRLLLLLAVAPIHVASSQRVAESRIAFRPLPVEPSAIRADTAQLGQSAPTSMTGEIARRSLFGLAGWLVGGGIGYALGYRYRDKSGGGDDPGIESAVLGLSIGSIVGGTIVAAAPRSNSKCGLARRLAFGLLGAGTGAGLGRLAYHRDGQILPVSAIGAGAAIAIACRQ